MELVRKHEKNADVRYFDMIFLDLDMPILDGHEACKQIIKFYEDKM